MQLVIAPTCAYLSQILSLRGYSSRISRGLLGAVCVMISGASMVCLPFAGVGALEVSLVGLSFSIGSVMFTLGATLIGEISPVPQRAAALGITNSIHTLAGLWAPFVMGRVVDIGVNPIAGFRAGYLYAGALVTVLGLVAALLIDPQGDLARLRPSAIFEHPARVSRSAS
jgi:MFS transporter, ACS family, D-galactonate transporter